jgi:hypothetical protein
MGDLKSREGDDVGAAFEERHEIGDRVLFPPDAVAEVGEAVGAEVDDFGPLVRRRDTGRRRSNELARVTARLGRCADEVPDELEVGMLQDRPQGRCPDIACAAMHNPVAHDTLHSPRLRTDRKYARNRDFSAASMDYQAFFRAGGAYAGLPSPSTYCAIILRNTSSVPP